MDTKFFAYNKETFLNLLTETEKACFKILRTDSDAIKANIGGYNSHSHATIPLTHMTSDKVIGYWYVNKNQKVGYKLFILPGQLKRRFQYACGNPQGKGN
jgi:hypothetical protein